MGEPIINLNMESTSDNSDNMRSGSSKLNMDDSLLPNTTFSIKSTNIPMHVQKRGNRGYEVVKFDKITERVQHLCKGLSSVVDPIRIAQLTIKNLYDGITTEELDRISAKIAESLKLVHPEYSTLAAKILISNLHKTTPKRFSECMSFIGKTLDIKSNRHYEFIANNAQVLDNMIIDENDYLSDYFGYKTLEHTYLIKITENVLGADGKPVYTDRDGNIVPSEHVEFTRRGRAIMRNERGTITSTLKVMTTSRVMDRPQYMFMRVAIAIDIDSDPNINVVLENIKQNYKAMSQMYFTHATPTLFNSCSKVQQLNSCFLLGTNDSTEGIMKTLSSTAHISKWSGGIGIHMSNIRCQGMAIKGTNGKASGLVRQLKIYNEVARTFDQGGKRPGAFVVYIEPWHGDILKFLRMKLNQGADTERARDLFYALWIPDLFIERVENGGDWSLFSENTAPGLSDVYDGMDICTKCDYCPNKAYAKYIHGANLEIDGVMTVPTDTQATCEHDFKQQDVFTELYNQYEDEGLAVNTIDAREILDAICEMQRESGTPYISFKDHANRMTNQKNIGTIKSSNLCTEIYEWSSSESYACCTLASINLRKFLVPSGTRQDGSTMYRVDHEKLHDIVRMITRNLDIIINVNDYPVPECEQNSHDYRPIGIGIQALADIFAIMRIPFLSEEAAKIDLEIAETIYHAALTESAHRARTHGPYKAFAGSPASYGILQIDMWMQNQTRINGMFAGLNPCSNRYDWDATRKLVSQGVRNSLLLAYMPTVSTSQIMGNNESFEPFASNIYTKTTQAGKFTVTNNAMIKHLVELGLWNDDIRRRIINDDGSVQRITEIPEDVREIYKTVWEMKQLEIMKRSALRTAFIDQSQSLNVHLQNNSNSTLRGVLLAGWKLGLKTGTYYIRTLPAAKAIKNNIAAGQQNNQQNNQQNKQQNAKVQALLRKEGSPVQPTRSFRILQPILSANLGVTTASAETSTISDSDVSSEDASENTSYVSGNTNVDTLIGDDPVERMLMAETCNMQEGCLFCSS